HRPGSRPAPALRPFRGASRCREEGPRSAAVTAATAGIEPKVTPGRVRIPPGHSNTLEEASVSATPTWRCTMTSATTTPARGIRGHPAEGHGLIVFASVLLLVVGCFTA